MTKPVGVIAAKGELPVKIADALKGVGREVFYRCDCGGG